MLYRIIKEIYSNNKSTNRRSFDCIFGGASTVYLAHDIDGGVDINIAIPNRLKYWTAVLPEDIMRSDVIENHEYKKYIPSALPTYKTENILRQTAPWNFDKLSDGADIPLRKKRNLCRNMSAKWIYALALLKQKFIAPLKGNSTEVSTVAEHMSEIIRRIPLNKNISSLVEEWLFDTADIYMPYARGRYFEAIYTRPDIFLPLAAAKEGVFTLLEKNAFAAAELFQWRTALDFMKTDGFKTKLYPLLRSIALWSKTSIKDAYIFLMLLYSETEQRSLAAELRYLPPMPQTGAYAGVWRSFGMNLYIEDRIFLEDVMPCKLLQKPKYDDQYTLSRKSLYYNSHRQDKNTESL